MIINYKLGEYLKSLSVVTFTPYIGESKWLSINKSDIQELSLTQEAASMLWPLIKEFSETGELK